VAKFSIAMGTIRGTDHGEAGHNQDGVTAGEMIVNGKLIRWGVLLDGCSAGLRSQAGVQDSLDFIERNMPLRLQEMPIEAIPNQLIMLELLEHIEFVAIATVLGKTEASRFVKGEFALIDHPRREDVEKYIRNFYLFTVYGFIQTDEQLLVFGRGDGAINLNNACTYIDQHNRALYPAYFCIPWNVPPYTIADRRMTVREYSIDGIEFLILGTDSWLKHKLLFEALPKFISHQTTRWLQRRIIVWARDSFDVNLPDTEEYKETVREAFGDDTSGLALIRLPE
jgi:hypothetical protein